MLALLAILFLAGAYALYAGEINFSKKRKLRRPHSSFFGIALILLAALPFVFLPMNDIFVIIGVVVVIIVVAFFVSEKISPEEK